VEERRHSASFHILLNNFLKRSYLLHTRRKRRKYQDLDFTVFSEHIADPPEPLITDKSGTSSKLLTLISA